MIIFFNPNIICQTISNDSLVLRVTFDGNTLDSSTNLLHGTPTNISYTTDRNNAPNKAAYFNGTTSSVLIPLAQNVFKKFKRFSLLVTLKPEVLDSVTGNIQGTLQNYGLYEFLTLQRRNPDNYLQFFQSQIRASIGSPYYQWGSWKHYTGYVMSWCTSGNQTASGYEKERSSIINNWFTFSLVYDSGHLRVYHNCDLVNNYPAFFSMPLDLCETDSFQINIGNIPDTAKVFGYRPFKGKIDDLRVYTRALSANEISIYSNSLCVPVPIKIIPKIKISINPCFPNKVTFSDITNLNGITIDKRTWRLVSGDSSNNIDFTKIFSTTGLHFIKLEIKIDSSRTESVIDSFYINNLKPTKFLSIQNNEIKICTNTTVTLNAKGGSQYKWTPCINLSDCNIPNPKLSIVNDEIYTITSSDNNNCLDTTTLKVLAIKDDIKLFVPTVFTPNNDGNNDDFGILFKSNLFEFDFSIFNRYGQIVFKTKSQNIKWKPSFETTANSYIWFLKYKSYLGCKTNELKGSVLLIK